MSKMGKPEMVVIRFAENDIVTASGGGLRSASVTLSGFTGGVPGDGQVKFNNNTYSINSQTDVTDFLGVMKNYGIRNAGIDNGTTRQSFRNTLIAETSKGANYWDGTFIYDPSATWSTKENTYTGVFIRQ